MNGQHGNGFFALGSALFVIVLTLTACEGGYGLSDAGKAQAPKGEASTYTADTPGQELMLDQAQKRGAGELKTQAPEGQAPASTANRPCEGFPGFDRGCPGGGR